MNHVLHGEGQSKVAVCGCGRLHFSYGPLTLHFERDEFVLFAESVGRLGIMVRQTGKDRPVLTEHVPPATVCH